jgi:hypothetical protein
VGRRVIHKTAPVKKFYVYIWLDGQTPFYVGIGNKNRLCRTTRNKWANGRRRAAEAQSRFRQDIIFSGTKETCKELEIYLISCYRSVNNGGCLFNFTKGGDGGDTFSSLPEEKKENVRNGARKVAEIYAITNGRKNGKDLFNNKKGLFDPDNAEKVLDGRRKGAIAQSKEDKSRGGRNGSKSQHSQRWQCTVTGHISTPCGLSSYQISRGIDRNNRIRIL